ncbi:uncharacterized protein LY89DRAFT_680584 [Mollisia scopiformis]|uniref:Uncharacterized protein n=1 Tax=Mollisia scopiformis TaxID=149040 RepID=A0A194XRT6_MOLSC|nr:uncharacterized protein LY89DRAFT_680584 [Mollisia scopiformis]KUJ22437.1 hypothetical protein LY89DRAFT_680584 [Mollisia scopiformis]
MGKSFRSTEVLERIDSIFGGIAGTWMTGRSGTTSPVMSMGCIAFFVILSAPGPAFNG